MSANQTKAKSIFLTAAEISEPSQREAYVAGQCPGDEALRREVEDLLRHQQGLGTFLEQEVAGIDFLRSVVRSRAGQNQPPNSLILSIKALPVNSVVSIGVR